MTPGFEAARDDKSLATQIAQLATASNKGPMSTETAARAIAYARGAEPKLSNWFVINRVMTDAVWRRHSTNIAERWIHQPHASPVYMAEFCWEVPHEFGMCAVHGVDLPLTWNNPDVPISVDGSDTPDAWRKIDPSNRRAQLARNIAASWAAFARTGNPTTPTLRWPEYDLQRRATMALDYDSAVIDEKKAPSLR